MYDTILFAICHVTAIDTLYPSRVTDSLHFNGHFPDGPGLAGTRMSPLWVLLLRDAMHKRGLCCRPVCVHHIGILYPDG